MTRRKIRWLKVLEIEILASVQWLWNENSSFNAAHFRFLKTLLNETFKAQILCNSKKTRALWMTSLIQVSFLCRFSSLRLCNLLINQHNQTLKKKALRKLSPTLWNLFLLSTCNLKCKKCAAIFVCKTEPATPTLIAFLRKKIGL